MKKKTLFSLIAGIMILIGLAACNNSSETTSTGNNSGSGQSSSESGSNGSGYSQGVTDTEILVGHTGPQTGPVAIYDLVRKGIDTYFKYVNENGGVNGRQLKLIAYDDQYQPAQAVQTVKRLVEEDKVFALLGSPCTPCHSATKDYVTKAGIPQILIGTGSREFFDPPIANYMGAGVFSYYLEARVFVDYAVNKLGAKRLALVYQNDDYGKEPYAGVKDAIENYPDAEIVVEVPHLATDTEFSSHAQKLADADPDAILVFATPSPAANLKKAIHKIGLDEPHYIVASVGANDSNVFNLAGKDVWEGTYSGGSSLLPEADPDNPDMQLFVERFKKEYPNELPSGSAMLGWMQGQVFEEALKRAGDDLTWDNFLKTFYTFDNWDGSLFAGISFSEDNHMGVTSMFITQAQDGIIKPITGVITVDPNTMEIKYSDDE